MQIIQVDPRTDALWQKLNQLHHSCAFHSPEWLSVLTDTYDLEVQAYVLLNETGEPIAGLPFCRIADFKGERLVTLPFSDYCDPLVATSAEWNCLADQLLREHHAFTIRCLHNHLPLADKRFKLINRAKWHGLDLKVELDGLWQELDSSARRAVKKAQTAGVVVRIAEREEELRAFFELHLRIRKYKYRLLAQPYHFFENIWRHFVKTQNGVLLIAEYEGEIVSGIMFLEWQNKLYYKFNASAPTHLSHRPNDLLIWEGIKYAKAKGYNFLDFGLSDWDQTGLIQYKRKFATEEKTICFLQHIPDKQLTPMKNPAGNLLPQLTELLTDETVPDYVSERAGELLYRFFI